MAQADTGRLSAGEIYDNVLADGRSELNRSSGALALSGFAAGLLMGLTGLGVAGAEAVLGTSPGAEFVALLFYPLGFIAVIIGRAQLFTENTLFPVVLVLETRRHLLVTLRLWVVVFATNIVGALAFAALVVETSALKPNAVTHMAKLGVDATSGPVTHVFTSAIIGGWLVALMAWMVSGAQHTIGQVAVVWLMTFIVGLLQFAHCIASSGYVLVAALRGDVSGPSYLGWLGAATAGNIVGGVVIVSLLNYGQVRVGEQGARRRHLGLAANEIGARRANEDLERRRSDRDPESIRDFACECSDAECDERILMTGSEYQRIRASARRFAVLDGHQTPEIEPVVERHDGYLIVEKTGAAGDAASQTWPPPDRDR